MHDFIAVGDIVTDAFIKLKDASVHCDVNKEHCTITMAFGAIRRTHALERALARRTVCAAG